jgi:hypothetical protein
MDLKKNINRYLTILLGIATILIYVLIGVFIFQKDLLFPKVQANPATCTVSDSLDATGNIRTTGGIFDIPNTWDSQYLARGKRSIGGAQGWDANKLYINGWGDWTSGTQVVGNLGVSGTIYGRMSCYALKIECNGNCTTLGGSIDDKCINGVGANYRAMGISCNDVRDDTGYSNTNCGGTCEAIPLSGGINVGDICEDTGGWDLVVTCCSL